MTKILDCTLRDGGYYNDWHFPLEVAKQTVASLDQAGVDIIEVGLKSAVDSKCSGLFKYCNEDYLGFLKEYPHSTFSFMLNVREFIAGDKVDREGLNTIINPAQESLFKMCRLALHFSDIKFLPEIYNYFKDYGYAVGINLMGVSLLSEDQISDAMRVIERLDPEVFYVADSFGSMLPDDVTKLVFLLKKNYSGSLGIHTHDNQGLAFSNSLRAIDDGVEYIDSTLTGMGRGAGNLSTEQILLWLQSHDERGKYHSTKILDVIGSYYEPMKSQHKWGFNYVYMLSGLNNIHPSFCMELCDGNKFSMSQIGDILEKIPNDKREKFSREILDEAINVISRSTEKKPASRVLPIFDISKHQVDAGCCIIIAKGASVGEYELSIDALIKRRSWKIFECNNTHVVDQFSDRITVILNQMRLVEYMQQPFIADYVVTGVNSFDDGVKEELTHFEYQIGEVNLSQECLTIPDFEAGQYVISLAALLGYRELYLVGFEGYSDPGSNMSMDRYFKNITTVVEELEITSVTPTQYQNIKSRSIFTL